MSVQSSWFSATEGAYQALCAYLLLGRLEVSACPGDVTPALDLVSGLSTSGCMLWDVQKSEHAVGNQLGAMLKPEESGSDCRGSSGVASD